MIELITGIIGGSFFSWLITHIYHKKSNMNVPDWALPLVEKLPSIAPTEKELLKLFQEEINKGTIKPHPIFLHVACPNCKAPIDELKESVFGDDYHTILDLKCPYCGWSNWSEV